MSSYLTRDFLACFRRLPQDVKQKLVRIIVFGGKTLIIQVYDSSESIPENQFTQSESELNGELWACAKMMQSIGSGLALMPNTTDYFVNFDSKQGTIGLSTLKLY